MKRAWRLIKIVFAFTIIVFAFLLGFVPGIPGWPLALFGLSMLAAEFVWARRLMKRVKRGANRLKDAALWPRKKRDQPRNGPKA
ncbi:MAG TPA: PGPGW domain-containing protein [Candidatus Thermoplasmatota archaeon]